jgi:hypothetical protein
MTVEYTEAVANSIKARYVELKDSGADYETRTALVQQIAGELTATLQVDVTEASVRSKLVSMKVYAGKPKKESATDSNSKEEYVKALRAVTGLELKSFEKATKVDLKALFEWLAEASAQFAADNGIVEPGAEDVTEA